MKRTFLPAVATLCLLAVAHPRTAGARTGPAVTDSDRDGLTDEVEATLGTDPFEKDSDTDGLGDGEEVLLWGSNPLNLNTDGRNDRGEPTGDDTNDAEEVAAGTDPNGADTDGDGLPDTVDPNPLRIDGDSDGLTDVEELTVTHTDPRLRDSDLGGAADGWEVRVGTDPNVAGDDPTSPDSDFDYLPDGDEVTIGTDPHNVDTDYDFVYDYNDAVSCNPLNADTDYDGLDDHYDNASMIGLCETPLDCDCNQPDRDHDGILDGDEPEGLTVADRDEDGLVDGVEELVYHSSPGSPDTDRDGLNDGDEVRTYLTDPASPDTDCDGVDDGAEIGATTDPLHAADGSNCDGFPSPPGAGGTGDNEAGGAADTGGGAGTGNAAGAGGVTGAAGTPGAAGRAGGGDASGASAGIGLTSAGGAAGDESGGGAPSTPAAGKSPGASGGAATSSDNDHGRGCSHAVGTPSGSAALPLALLLLLFGRRHRLRAVSKST